MQTLETALVSLGIEEVASSISSLIKEAEKKKVSYEEFLRMVAGYELEARAVKREAILLRLAHFPVIKTLSGFDFSFSPEIDPCLINQLAELRFIQERENVLFLGPPGVGKTHLAIALGVEACRRGMKTYFTTLEEMIGRLAAGSPMMLSRRLRRYLSCQLLVIDEVGYLPLSATQAHLFFQVISSRYEQGSTIITSNKPVIEWGEYLSDPTLAAALLDRFLHHCHVVSIKGESYRLKEKTGLLRAQHKRGISQSTAKQSDL